MGYPIFNVPATKILVSDWPVSRNFFGRSRLDFRRFLTFLATKIATHAYLNVYQFVCNHVSLHDPTSRNSRGIAPIFSKSRAHIFFPKPHLLPRDISQFDERNDHHTSTNQRQPTRVDQPMSALGRASSTDMNVEDRKDTVVRRGGRLKHAFPDGCDSRHDRRDDRKNVDYHHREEKDGVPKFLTSSSSKSNAKDSIMLVNYLSLP